MLIILGGNIINIIHDYVVTRLVADDGVICNGMIDGCAERPFTEFQSIIPFPTVIDKAGSLLYSIIKFHPYVDGCKRTGLLSAMFFLFYNGYVLEIPKDSAKFLLALADTNNPNAPNEQEVIKWVKENSHKSHFSIFLNWMLSLVIKFGFPLEEYTKTILKQEMLPSFKQERFKQKALHGDYLTNNHRNQVS